MVPEVLVGLMQGPVTAAIVVGLHLVIQRQLTKYISSGFFFELAFGIMASSSCKILKEITRFTHLHVLSVPE